MWRVRRCSHPSLIIVALAVTAALLSPVAGFQNTASRTAWVVTVIIAAILAIRQEELRGTITGIAPVVTGIAYLAALILPVALVVLMFYLKFSMLSSRGEPNEWGGVAPQVHRVPPICGKDCSTGHSTAVWQLPDQAKIHSTAAVSRFASIRFVGGYSFKMQDASDCPEATVGWALNAVRGTSTMPVGQGKLTNDSESDLSFTLPEGTEQVALILERLDKSSCSTKVEWTGPVIIRS